MSSIDILFFTVIIIVSLSFILTIIAFVILSSLTSKTTLLEREIDKRSAEFDNFRKELSSNKHAPAASVIESNEPIITTQQETSISNEDTIQIFRNVRSGFENSSAAPSEPAPELQTEPVQTPTPVEITPKGRAQVFSEPVEQEDEPPQPPPTVAYEQPRETIQRKFTLPLYSDTTKDADFQTLWKNITLILQNNSGAHISIDFSHINFLYDKEMDYLEKMNYLISNQRSRLSLVHCEQELLALIDRKPHLRTIIEI